MSFMWFGFGLFPFIFIAIIAAGIIKAIVRNVRRNGGSFPQWGNWNRNGAGFDNFPRPVMPGQTIAPPLEPRKAKGQESNIFKIAYKMRGRLTVSDVVIETNMDIAEADKLLSGMVDNTRVRMEVTDSGTVVYEFPEIMDRYLRDKETGRST